MLFLANPVGDATVYQFLPQVEIQDQHVYPKLRSQIVSSCDTMSLAYFPYDTQSCSFRFKTMPVSGFASHLQFVAEQVIVDGSPSNDMWNFIDCNATRDEDGFNISITVSRNSYYYLQNLIYPTIA